MAKTNGKKPTKSAPAKKAPAKAAAPKPAREATMPYLTSIEVSGFKCFVEPTPVELGPLTVLAGANSSGKSSIMQPLLLMKQTLESPFNVTGPFLLNGPNVRFTDAGQLFSKNESHSSDRFKVCLNFNSPSRFLRFMYSSQSDRSELTESTSFLFERAEDMRLLVAQQIQKRGDDVGILSPGMTATDIRKNFSHHSLIADEKAFVQRKHKSGSRLNDGDDSLHVKADAFFLEVWLGNMCAGTAAFVLKSAIWNSLHIPGLRGVPERLYPLTSARPPFRGTFPPYVATIVNAWKRELAPELGTLIRYLSEIEIAGSISAREIDQAHLEVLVDPTPQLDSGSTRFLRSLADVGIGVSQVLPFLVALVAAEPGQMVYCEQPELHLHPRAQYRLAGVMVDAMKRGVRIVVETHSALLLTALQTAVAKGELPPDDLKLYWFSRDKNGHAKATKANLDSRGRYNDWPVDFGDVEIDAVNNYLDAAQAQLPGVAS